MALWHKEVFVWHYGTMNSVYVALQHSGQFMWHCNTEQCSFGTATGQDGFTAQWTVCIWHCNTMNYVNVALQHDIVSVALQHDEQSLFGSVTQRTPLIWNCVTTINAYLALRHDEHWLMFARLVVSMFSLVSVFQHLLLLCPLFSFNSCKTRQNVYVCRSVCPSFCFPCLDIEHK